MAHLTLQERELVSLGAAMGSNCVSCIEHHVPASRSAGLSDGQILEAIQLADRLRQVPARKTLDAALDILSGLAPAASPDAAGETAASAAKAGKPCCI